MNQKQHLQIIGLGESQTVEFKTSYSDEVIVSLVADICKDMRIIEKYGSGIGRIRDYLKKEELPDPEFKLISEGFQVTVFSKDFVDNSKTQQEREQVRSQEGEQETQQEINPNILKLLSIIENEMWGVADLMRALSLKDRTNFIYTYLHPAMQAGYVRMLYPDNPTHRGQKYLLTDKGRAAINQK